MIVFDLRCGASHVFEAWFGSGADYDDQAARGLIACPLCGDAAVAKAAMAPAVPLKGNRAASPAQVKTMLADLHRAQRSMEAQCDYVGPAFAAEARAIHDGEAVKRGIYGEASPADARALVADGIAIAPLPFRPRALDDA